MRYGIALVLFLLGGGCLAQGEGSLWSDEAGSILRDLRAQNVGDILTVIVSETSSASSKADTKGSKADSASVDAGIGPILANLIPAWKLGASESSTASGSTTRSGSLTAQMSVTVKKVLPNGNLMIEGKRNVMVNKEMQKLVLTGVVRPADIGTSNTIPSYLIADAEIHYDGKGPVGDRQGDGLIVRAFKWLFGGILK
jgi:flagellar L-ring protein precursor FlgH